MSCTVNTCKNIQMSLSSEDVGIRHLKEILKKYMQDMFQAMATAFLNTIEDQFERMHSIYQKLRAQKIAICQQKQTLINIQTSINRLSEGLQALALQITSTSSREANWEYFNVQGQKISDCRPKSSKVRNVNTSNRDIESMKYITRNTSKQPQVQSNQLHFLKNLRKIGIRNKQNQSQDPLIARKLL